MVHIHLIIPYFKMFFRVWLLVYLHAAVSLEMNDILKELSWPLRLKILNEISPAQNKTSHEKPLPDVKPTRSPSTSMLPSKESPPAESHPELLELTTSVTEATSSLSLEPQSILVDRRVGVQLLRAGQRRANEEEDDRDMRLKLFRLMYETVRDSDLKVKRAELIKEHYLNSSSFEIGYLIGEITDKANIITDISVTLKKFHREWKPIEHINAYEQISNQALEVTRLIDLVRILNKKDADKENKQS